MQNDPEANAIVAGAGIGGIATAVRLAAKGYKVKVFETNSYPGGKLSEIRAGKYRFDAGPSLFTLPENVEKLFKLAGEEPEEHFQYASLEVLCNYFFSGGTRLQACQDKEKFAGEIEKKTSDQADTVLKFLRKSAQLYDLTDRVFIRSSFHRLKTFLSKYMLRAGVNWWRLNAFTTMHKVIEKYFKDPRTIQLFDRYATYNGSSPYKAPGTLNVIPHLEYNLGAYIPRGGMHAITMSLVCLAERMGTEFYFETPVEQIIHEQGRVQGVRAGGELHHAAVVISDVDLVRAYDLIDGHDIPTQYLKQERSSSALVFYWGIKKSFPDLDLHNIFFSDNYKEEFDNLFDRKGFYPDPTIYINITSKYVPGDAPDGCENWFTMINVPENVGQDWEKIRAEARGIIIKKLNKILDVDIEALIEEEDYLDPVLIEQRTASWHGSLYGNSSNSMFAAFRRHPNFSPALKGLYFTGGSVHPGGGIPLCLSSAEIIDDMIR